MRRANPLFAANFAPPLYMTFLRPAYARDHAAIPFKGYMGHPERAKRVEGPLLRISVARITGRLSVQSTCGRSAPCLEVDAVVVRTRHDDKLQPALPR